MSGRTINQWCYKRLVDIVALQNTSFGLVLEERTKTKQKNLLYCTIEYNIGPSPQHRRTWRAVTYVEQDKTSKQTFRYTYISLFYQTKHQLLSIELGYYQCCSIQVVEFLIVQWQNRKDNTSFL